MEFVVLKFGGTSVSTRARWETIESIVREHMAANKKPVVVCSAISGVSNLLEELLKTAVKGEHKPTVEAIVSKHQTLADELEVDFDATVAEDLQTLERLALGASLTNEVSPRLHARILAMGELMLTKLGAAFLQSRGLGAQRLDSRDYLKAISQPGESDSKHFLSAPCEYGPDPALQTAILKHDVTILQGFIARDAQGETVLLGRGGSDTSAAYFAAKIGAARLEIWTDVPGMYTANPREVGDARLLKRLDYEEAQEIATMGAKVLHPRCIAPVRDHNIPLEIRCTPRPEIEGTVISSDVPDFGPQVKAISAKTGVVLVSMNTIGMWQQVGFLADAFVIFKNHGLSVDLVATSESNVTVSLDPAANVLDPSATEALLADLGKVCHARLIGPCAAVSMVGHNIRSILHQLGPALEAFDEQRIYMVSQAASDLNLTFVVDQDQAPRLVRKLHALLLGERVADPLLGPTWGALFGNEEDLQKVDEDAWWVARRAQLVDLMENADGPLYAYHRATVEQRADEVKGLGVHHAFFAIKANDHPDLLRILEGKGINFECVSPWELNHVFETMPNLDPTRVLYTPNFAPREDYELGFQKGVYVTLDNLHPLETWPETFAGQKIIVRIDPGKGRGHHKKVKTAGTQSKFGVPLHEVSRLAELCKAHDVEIIGLHSHVGSGIKDPQTWAETAALLLSVAGEIGGVNIINVGGGLGVVERAGQPALELEQVRSSIANVVAAHPGVEIWMEPGRYFVAEAGVLLAKVTQTKSKGESASYVGLDVGMNGLIRPALYGAYHAIVNLSRLNEPVTMVADVVGPICETGDVLGHKRRLPQSETGDVFLIGTAGAYGRVMASQYNRRPIPTELVLD